MERYEAYKDSGVEWLGEIPVGWEVKSFRYVFDLITDKAGDNLLKIGLENIESGTGKFVATDNEFEGDGIHFLSGDILFGKLRPYLAKVYLADFRGKAVGDFFVFRSKGEIKEQFGAKLISSKRFIDITNSSTYGSKMPRVSWDFISELLIAYPNLEEQTAIANFLDRKITEIDALIAQKERLLELYEEEKTAIINHAVTKGLDPNAELKDSSIDWLGEIPISWKLIKLRYLSNINTGEKDTENRQDDGQYPFYVRSQTIERISTYSYDGEAILTAGDGVGVGKVFHYVNGKFDYHQRVYKVSDFKGVIGKYVFYYMQINFHKEVMRISAKSTVDSLRLPMLQNFPVCLPYQKSEQIAIIQHIEAETTRIDTKIAKTQRVIELQKEYRTALISEVVTGKIKVPELSTQETSA